MFLFSSAHDEIQNIRTKGFSKENTKEMVSLAIKVQEVIESQTKKGLGTRLAADIDNVVGVGEAVELSGRALCVGTHVLEVQPVTDIENGVEASALSDAVDAIAGRTPDGILEALALGSGMGSGGLEEGLTGGAENLGDRLLVVKHDV